MLFINQTESSRDETAETVKDKQPPQPPQVGKFLVDLDSQTNTEVGDEVKLMCIADGSVKNVSWEKDGKKVNSFVFGHINFLN